MNTANLKFIAIIAAAWPLSMKAQVWPLGVCDALNSIRDHQAVVIRAAVASTRHQTFLFEGTGKDPCPGWPRRFFTAPSVIPIVIYSYSRVHVSDDQARRTLDFELRLKKLQEADPSAPHMVTLSGVLIRKRWLLVFRTSDGTYCCGGVGLDGGYAALLVVTSIVAEGR
jgi:hypothetical protein